MLVEHTTDFALLYFPIHRYFVYRQSGRQTGESEHITTIATIIIIKIVCTCPPLSSLPSFHAVVTLTLSTFDMK